ncbi:MAG: DUF6364 family protein [Thermofilaceae archaeon]
MAKKKVTLSIDEDLLSEVKKLVAFEGSSLSGIVEEYLEGLVFERWVRELCASLGLGELEPTSESEIPLSRPKGLNAAEVVRELREGRMKEYGS